MKKNKDLCPNHIDRSVKIGRMIGGIVGTIAIFLVCAVLSIVASNQSQSEMIPQTSVGRRAIAAALCIIVAAFAGGQMTKRIARDVWRFFGSGWGWGAIASLISYAILRVIGFGYPLPYAFNRSGLGYTSGAIVIGGFVGLIAGLITAIFVSRVGADRT